MSKKPVLIPSGLPSQEMQVGNTDRQFRTERKNRIGLPGYVLVLLLYTTAGLSGVVHAHDFWIAPDPYVLAQPGEVKLILREGVDMNGDSLPYIPEWFDDFSITDSDGRRRIESTVGDDPAATVVVKYGAALVGYQSSRNFVEIGPKKFARYLSEEGLEYAQRLREKRGETYDTATEYFVRCAKSLIKGGASARSRIFEAKLGYTLELIPQNDPLALSPGEQLTIRLLYRDKPIANTRIRAVNSTRPEDKIDQRTNADGLANLVLPHSGVWLIKAVHIISLGNDERARWESFWASLTFEIM